MECDKFEVSGLLYVSGELGESEAISYEAHLAECEECRSFTDVYKLERASLYTENILGEQPSPNIDAAILKNAMGGAKAHTFTPIMFFLKKYAAVPVFLMLIMVAIGGYVKYHTIKAVNLRAEFAEKSAAPAQNSLEEAAAREREFMSIDSSMGDSGARYPKTKGNMNMDGVFTVKGGGGE